MLHTDDKFHFGFSFLIARRQEFADRRKTRIAAGQFDIGSALPLARRAGQFGKIHITGKRPAARMDLENRQPRAGLRQRKFDQKVEASGPKQRGVHEILTVRGSQDDDAFELLDAVHLRQELGDGAVRD